MTIREKSILEYIDTQPAGRELDALVAEYVMGLIPCHSRHYEMLAPFAGDIVTCEHSAIFPLPCYDPERPTPYSADISAAWQVVEKLVGNCDGRDFFIECWGDGEWFVASHPMGYSSRKPTATCDGKTTGKPSAPLAICRMALKMALE